MSHKQRQAISPLIAVVLLIGIVAVGGGALLIGVTDTIKTAMLVDSIDIKEINIQNTDTASYITATVKNNGNSGLSTLKVIVDLGDDTTFEANFDPADLNSGVSSSVREKITDSAGTDVYLTAGTKYLVEVTATTSNGGIISETIGIRPF